MTRSRRRLDLVVGEVALRRCRRATGCPSPSAGFDRLQAGQRYEPELELRGDAADASGSTPDRA